MPFEERLLIARRSSLGVHFKLLPLECGARLCFVVGVGVLCLTEEQLQNQLTRLSGLRTRYPAIKVVSHDPIPSKKL